MRETLVLCGDGPERLRSGFFVPGSLRIASYDGKTDFAEGVDYRTDPERGTVRRIRGGRIPDLADHPFAGSATFDHTLVSEYSLQAYTVWADYEALASEGRKSSSPSAAEVARVCVRPLRPEGLRWLAGRAAEDGALRLLVYGDSISTGAEASSEESTYFRRFACRLERTFGCPVDVRNGSRGGDTSEDGLRRLTEDALPHRPHLCLIAFGMNDQNIGEDDGHFVSPTRFARNLRGMVASLRACDGGCIVALVTPCLAHPRWRWASPEALRYADAIRNLAEEDPHLALADVQRVWESELSAGKSPESLLLNHINHPNDYGHALYATALAALLPAVADLGEEIPTC